MKRIFLAALVLLAAFAPARADEAKGLAKINHIVVIYLENRSFDNLYGLYPGAEGLAALLPCQWSYGEIAQPLMAALPADPVYADWIRMFGHADYDALVAETTGLLDRLAGPGPWARLSAVFSISVRYEGEFWDMAYAAA